MLSSPFCYADQKPVLISPAQFNEHQQIQLANLEGWVFKQGHNVEWAKPNLDLAGWQSLKPTELTREMKDENGRVEGWFRIKLKLSAPFENIPLDLNKNLWVAADIYLNGKLIRSFGKTGKAKSDFKAHNPVHKAPIPLGMKTNREYLLAIHVVHYEGFFTPRGQRLKSANLANLVNLSGPKYRDIVKNKITQSQIYNTLWISITVFFMQCKGSIINFAGRWSKTTVIQKNEFYFLFEIF